MIDLVVSDVVQFYYIKFNTQVVTSGKIAELNDTNAVIEISEDTEVEVPRSHILKRFTRIEVPVKPVSVEVDPDAHLNVGVSGVRFRRKKKVKKYVEKD